MDSPMEYARRFLFARRYDYRRTFRSPPGEAVLKDLAKFCRANVSTFHENDRAHCLAEGRREVWLRIVEHLNLTEEQLWLIYSGGADVQE